MNKSDDNAKKDYSIYVYGKIYDLVKDLNSYNIKYYINNEKNVDLWKEFKYKRRKKFRFISVLDYYASVKNKKWEFDIIPIIFNEEYEILHIGVSIIFNDNFAEEYKKCRCSYIELFICNFENVKTNQNQYEWSLIPPITSSVNIMKFLIDMDDLKRIYTERKGLDETRTITRRQSSISDINNDNKYPYNIINDSCYVDVNTWQKQVIMDSKENDFLNQGGNMITYNNRCSDPIGNAKPHLSGSGKQELDTHFIHSRNGNIIQDNDMSTLRSNLSSDSSSNLHIRFSTSNDEEEFTEDQYKKNEEINWKNVNNNREILFTDVEGGGGHTGGVKYHEVYLFSNMKKDNSKYDKNICSNICNNICKNNSFIYTNGEHINNDKDTSACVKDSEEVNQKMTYPQNVKKVNEVDEKMYISSEKFPTNEIFNYDYLYSKSKRQMVYIEEPNGSKQSLGMVEEDEVNGEKEKKTFLINHARNSYTQNICTSLEMKEVIVEGKITLGKTQEGGEIAHTGQSNCDDNIRITKLKESMNFNHDEAIKSNNNVHIMQNSEYRKNVYTTKSSDRKTPMSNYNIQESKNNENNKCNNFKFGFFSSKGNRTYNEDRVITIKNVNEFIQKEYKEVIEGRMNYLNASVENEYYDMLQKMQSVDRTYLSSSSSVQSLTSEESSFSTPPPYMYCAIYDGHNGEKAVNIIQKLLHVHVYSYFIKGNGMSNSLKYAFHSMDEHLCKKTINNEEDNHSNFSSGSTACVSVIFNNLLYIANIGDSRCVLSKNGRAIVITVDHRASGNKKEEERIITSGGILDDEGYLGGCLGVCRGFGSFDKKTKEKLKGLVCEPDLFQISLTDDDEFLIICCDGIFDVMTSQEAVNTVRTSLVQSSDPTIAAEALCEFAYKRKALDNLSVVVVIFQNPEMKKRADASANANLEAGQAGRVRRRIRFSSLKGLIGS
ncbi:protein phosphatase 2C [Plasmodium gonderi]|uniref:Protein phosphatase 2C n=1 Tax=Plasmodium gonderi TaxID=77519 RepID=A0A1Y1JAJ6_PLAGO|nr:protein phosphatase 2C [Plasmodium gonderi]GAW79280.1 protein phosphatase 2C [Plasmodium gonderi]